MLLPGDPLRILGPMQQSTRRSFRAASGRLRTALTRRAAVALGVLGPAMTATAASQGPPTPELNARVNMLLAYAVMFGLTALVIAASLWPSKRSHQE